MLEMFRMGGFGMYPTALFGFLMLGAAVRYAQKPETRWLPLQIALGVLTLSTGALGFVSGIITTTQHLEEVPADKMSLIEAIGLGESLHNVALAFGLVAFATLAASVGSLRLARAPQHS